MGPDGPDTMGLNLWLHFYVFRFLCFWSFFFLFPRSCEFSGVRKSCQFLGCNLLRSLFLL